MIYLYILLVLSLIANVKLFIDVKRLRPPKLPKIKPPLPAICETLKRRIAETPYNGVLELVEIIDAEWIASIKFACKHPTDYKFVESLIEDMRTVTDIPIRFAGGGVRLIDPVIHIHTIEIGYSPEVGYDCPHFLHTDSKN